MLRLCTLIFQYDIHKKCFKRINIIEIIIMTSFCHLLHVLSKTILVRFEAVIPGKGEVLTKKIFKFTKKIILTKLRF